jgi:glycosyltransferase involved in cell wall biosynthesis
MRIAVITCYHDPDYVRARSLRAGLKSLPGTKIVVIKNTHKGLLRYPEVLMNLRRVLKTQKIDVCLLTFRGQEILPFVLFLAGKRPVWFDEFIVPIAYATGEQHHRSWGIRLKYFLARVSEPMYRRWLRRCTAVLADTTAHAELSARLSNMNLSKYTAVPVGTDENLFKPAENVAKPEPFRVFYYSTGMQPLHGVEVVLDAARNLKANTDIDFLMVGGGKTLRQAVQKAVADGAHISYEPWIPFAELPATMHAAGVCLGGPFGNTPQAQHVITTKTYQILAAGEPAIVGASEATSEFLVGKQNALVVPQADAEALARTIRWAHAHPKELKTIAANGRKLYERQFSSNAIAEKLRPLVDAVS